MSSTGKATRKPGKSGPAASRFLIQGLRSGASPKNHQQTKTLCQQAAHRLTRRGFGQADSSEPAPSPRPWIFAPGATPTRSPLRYHLHPCIRRRARLEQPLSGRIRMAGFQTSTHGRFCADHRGTNHTERCLCTVSQPEGIDERSRIVSNVCMEIDLGENRVHGKESTCAGIVVSGAIVWSVTRTSACAQSLAPDVP
jgi:hypothetical protein